MLPRTRYSLFYLVTYLSLTGIAFLLAPGSSLRILFSNREYDPVFVRFVGSFMLALGFVVMQMIRYRLEALYPTTIMVRVFFIVCISWFYFQTKDPLFIAILGVVLLGVTSTSIAFLVDRSKRRQAGW